MKESLFRASDGAPIDATSRWVEADLQLFCESHLKSVLGLDLIASEFTMSVDGVRMRADSIAVDSDKRISVVEYKNNAGDKALMQAVSYATALQLHPDLVAPTLEERLGPEDARRVDFRNPRVILVAGSFKEHVELASRSIVFGVSAFCVRHIEGVVSVSRSFEHDSYYLRSEETRAKIRAGLDRARAQGKLRGRKPKLGEDVRGSLFEDFRKDVYTISDLSEKYGVGRATIYREMELFRARQA